MKVLCVFLILGSLTALAASQPANDVEMAQLLLRSCDHNADNALNAAEFAGCLMQTARQQSAAAHGMAISRSEFLQSFMDEADTNNDLRADELELQEWSKRWFLSDIFGGGGNNDNDNGDDGGDGSRLSFNEVINKIGIILEYFSAQNYAGAVSELYLLVSGYELSEDAQASIALTIKAIEAQNYGEAIGHVYFVIRDIAGGDDAGGIFIVSVDTVTNVASLLQSLIVRNSANFNLYFYRTLAGLIVDFTFLTEQSASSVAALIKAVFEGNSEQFYNSLIGVVGSIVGISSETATALISLLQAAGGGGDVGAAIVAVITTLFEDDNVREIANTVVAVLQALIAGDDDEAIAQLTMLYALIAGDSSDEDRVISAEVAVQIETIIQNINHQDSSNAISVIQALLDGQNGGDSLSNLVRNELQLIVTDLENNDFSDALAQILVIFVGARSSSLSTSSAAAFLVAVQSVGSGSESSAVTSLELLLQENISSSFRDKINDILEYLEEENYARAMTLMVASVIGSGNSISASVAQSLYVALRYSISGEYDEAASVIESILDDEDDLDADISLVLLYVAQLLSEGNSQGALTAINVIIEEFEANSSEIKH